MCRRKESGSNIKASEEKCLKDSGGASVKSTSEKFLTQNKAVTKPPTPQLMQSNVDKSMPSSDALKAEIIWTLYSVFKGFSSNSAKDLNATFCEMFSNSVITSYFQLGPDKLKCLTNWGIAPHIQQSLLNKYVVHVQNMSESFS